eukprot:2008951-Pyramimonas_sp.AAC.1
MEEGMIDILGAPPCSPWSRARFRPGGPRPLRFRDQPLGRLDLTEPVRTRVTEANVLLSNFLGLCDTVEQYGGAYLMQHPIDPHEEPFPSIWDLDAVKVLERHSVEVTDIDQCMPCAATVSISTRRRTGSTLRVSSARGVCKRTILASAA